MSASVLVVVGGFSGLAYAANGAAPGDPLYGLDRALEAVGIGNGGAAERITEAQDLAQQGQQSNSLQHAASVVKDDPGAQTALLDAAQRLQAAGANDSQQEVGALLDYLATNVGHIDGHTAAQMAQAIHGSTDVPPVTAPPTDVPPVTAPPTDVPPVTAPPTDVPPTDVPPVPAPPVTTP